MKPLVAIFAHPDDEAFGPAGTLALEAKQRDVYIICATGGEAGQNSHKTKSSSLSEIRKEELKRSARILGIKKVYFLGYEDGTLCNKNYHEIAGKIGKKLKTLKPDTLMTFEHHGVSGHIDHIAISMIASFLFRDHTFLKQLMFYCIDEREGNEYRIDYFIYFPKGYKKSQIDKTIDISKVWDLKVQAMMAHESQRHDAETILEYANTRPKEEHFLMRKRG